MRWFILLLLTANLVLFFWLRHDTLTEQSVAALPPPDIGRLQLANEKDPVPHSPPPEAATSPPPGVLTDEVETPASARPLADTRGPAPDWPVPESPVSADLTAKPPSLVTAAPADVADVRSDPVTGAATAVQEQTQTKAPRSEIPDAVTAAANPRPADPQDGSSDRLANTDPDEAPAAPIDLAESATQPSVAPAQPSCALVGPMESAAADALIKQLPAFVMLLSDVTVEVLDVDSYYVMIPPLASRAAGLQTLAALEAAGVTDTWLFRRGRYRNAISLGLYSRRGGAERHRRNVTAKGFEAEVVENGTRQQRRRLLVKNVDGGDVALSLPLPDGVQAQSQACP